MVVREIAISVDFDGVIVYKPINLVQNDYQTCQFNFTTADAFVAGETMFVSFVLPSGTTYIVEATITTPTGTSATLLLPTGVLSEVGEVKMQVAVYDGDGLRNTQYMQMVMNVIEDFSQEAIEASDQLPILTELISDCNDVLDAEALRVTAESNRVDAEDLRVTAEGLRVTAEGLRVTAEGLRVTAEGDRVDAESNRVDAEGLRVTAEGLRVTAEGLRVDAESDRVTAEGLRDTAEGLRDTAEGLRDDAEVLRASAESDRVDAESDRDDAEGLRDAAESDRDDAEGLRDTAEGLRDTAEGLRDTAEGLRDTAETAREDAEDARAVFEAYDSGTAYVVGNKVAYDGSSYVCIQNGTGQTPDTAITYWLLMAEKGDGSTADLLTGLSVATSTDVIATDSVLEGIGKLQGQVGDRAFTEDNYVTDNESVTSSLDALDMALKDTDDNIEAQTVFDVVIKTQAQFEALIASATWLDAVSVCFVGDGGTLKFTRSDGTGIKIPATVKQIQGVNNAIIEVTNFSYNGVGNKAALYYDSLPTAIGYSIVDLKVDCTSTTTNAYGIRYCINLIRCTSYATGVDYGYGIRQCKTLVDCLGVGISTGVSCYGFYDCSQIVNCTGGGLGTSDSIGNGFYSCSQLVNCLAVGTGVTEGYGFNNCSYMSNCKGIDGEDSTTALLGGTNTYVGITEQEIGDRAYTEDNYVTDDEEVTESIDALDIALKDASDVADDAIPTASIVNDLTTGGTDVPLSAEQGKELKEDIDTVEAEVDENKLNANKRLVDLEVKTNALSNPASNTEVEDSTRSSKALPVNASDFAMANVKLTGLTVKNLVSGEDIANSGTVSFASVNGNKYYDTLNDTVLTGDGTTLTATNSSGATADMMIIDLNPSGLQAETTETLAEMFPTYFDGLQSVGATRIKVVDDETTELYLPENTLRSVPSTADTVERQTDGRFNKVQRVQRYVLQSADIEGIKIVDTVTTRYTIGINGIKNAVTDEGYILMPDYRQSLYANRNSADSHNTFMTYGDGTNKFYFITLNGTYADLAAARAALAGTVIYYELATPITTQVNAYGQLISKPSGTVYVENILGDVDYYVATTGIVVSGMVFSGIDEVLKIDPETGVETDVTADCTLNVAKDGFTCTELSAGDIVWYALEIDGRPKGLVTYEYYDDFATSVDDTDGHIYSWRIVTTNGVARIETTELS